MTDQVDQSRRDFLYLAAGGLGAVAAGATAVPFIGSMLPAADTLAAAITEYNVGTVEPGQMVVIQWQGKPVFVTNRTPEMLKQVDGHDDLLKDPNSEANEKVQNEWMETAEQRKYRAIKPEYLIVLASCTHLGCIDIGLILENKLQFAGFDSVTFKFRLNLFATQVGVRFRWHVCCRYFTWR